MLLWSRSRCLRCPLQRHPLRQRHSLRHRHSQPLLLCHRDLNAPTPAGATCRGHPDRGQGTVGATTEGRATLVFGRTQWDTQSQLARSGKTATTAAPAPYHRHLQRHPHRHPHRHLGPPVSRAATSATTGEAFPQQITAFARSGGYRGFGVRIYRMRGRGMPMGRSQLRVGI